ncbi:hypothetical protein SDC9_132360 [bioreactor metagenome]|uniref:Uncharacterized protein n=1 Tax=bioreactor metagenome TaxID=1076179 RepID=A0A645D9I2_9ZZZZ
MNVTFASTSLFPNAGIFNFRVFPVCIPFRMSSLTLNVNQISSKFVIVIIGAPVPTNSPCLGKISDTSPSIGETKKISPKYDFTSETAPFALFTRAKADALSSCSAPFTAI